MAYQTPLTILDVTERIANHRLVLPAIRREFVWKVDQICELWDSLLRGYPIGAFLFWEVPDERRRDVRMYEFITKYDIRDPHNPEWNGTSPSVVAVLDGQQRLTAFHIGLRGDYRYKLPRKRWTNPDAFPARSLHLRLEEGNDESGIAGESTYIFEFLTQEGFDARSANGELWFKVGDVLDMRAEDTSAYDWLADRGHVANRDAMRRLHALIIAVHEKPVVAHYVETTADIDRVLDIFIRVNRGGTQLTFSDLLLSLATAEWDTLDARREVNSLVDDMNAVGEGFQFGSDRVLKSALVLSDFENIKFKAQNFGSSNVGVIEENWPDLRKYLLMATQLIAQFGLSYRTLSAENAVIPIAYYLYNKQASHSYLTADATFDDRRSIRRWLVGSLLTGTYWTGAVDPILIEFRRVLADEGADAFPAVEFERRLKDRVGKVSTLSEEEIEDLVDVRYSDRRALLALAVLSPSVSTIGMHVDHLHPRAAFYRSATRGRGLSGDEAASQKIASEQLANLHLLEEIPNQEKSDQLLEEWMAGLPGPRRESVMQTAELEGLPLAIEDFDSFYVQRRQRLVERLVDELA